jgi:hypothetical protein
MFKQIANIEILNFTKIFVAASRTVLIRYIYIYICIYIYRERERERDSDRRILKVYGNLFYKCLVKCPERQEAIWKIQRHGRVVSTAYYTEPGGNRIFLGLLALFIQVVS